MSKPPPLHCIVQLLTIDADGLVGEVLFWSIKQCIGLDLYSPEVHTSWVKVYSRMLTTMVPVAVMHEMKDNSAQTRRFVGSSASSVSSGEDSTFLNQKHAATGIMSDHSLELNAHILANLNT